MKVRTLCAAALVTLFVGGAAASAAPLDPLPTNGKVEVVEGKIDPGTGVTDPEKPGEILPEIPGVIIPNPNEDMGPLEISHAPALDFGKIKTSTGAQTSFAGAVVLPAGGSGTSEGEKRGQILQFGDLRTDATGYTVSAELTQQFTIGATTNVLNGSTIAFANPFFATATGATGILPDVRDTFTLSTSDGSFGGKQIVASAKAGEKNGKGMWAVEYGSSEKVGDKVDTTGNSVTLTVPASTASSMAKGNYVAVIEWSISVTPG